MPFAATFLYVLHSSSGLLVCKLTGKLIKPSEAAVQQHMAGHKYRACFGKEELTSKKVKKKRWKMSPSWQFCSMKSCKWLTEILTDMQASVWYALSMCILRSRREDAESGTRGKAAAEHALCAF